MAERSPPRVVSPSADAAFAAQARQMELRPDDRWVGGYVDYEWDRLRHILEAAEIPFAATTALEVGCNVGASAIVLEHLGARVTGIDLDPAMVALARLNAERHGCNGARFEHVPDTRRMPFADAAFDLVTCNSVLEYVDVAHRRDVQREIDRVLRPGGTILVCSTSNRLWPIEVHSRRWANYVPRWLDGSRAASRQRGVWPWSVRYGFGPHYRNIDTPAVGGSYRQSRERMGVASGKLKLLCAGARMLGVGPGLLAPSLSCVLVKAT